VFQLSNFTNICTYSSYSQKILPKFKLIRIGAVIWLLQNILFMANLSALSDETTTDEEAVGILEQWWNFVLRIDMLAAIFVAVGLFMLYQETNRSGHLFGSISLGIWVVLVAL